MLALSYGTASLSWCLTLIMVKPVLRDSLDSKTRILDGGVDSER